MFAINSHYGALQPLAIVGMLHVNLLPAPLPLELVVEALPGLLTVEAEAVLLLIFGNCSAWVSRRCT